MDIFILGVGHRNAPVEVREMLQDPDCLGNDYVFHLHTTGLLSESLLLSTCNRLELAGFAHDPLRVRDQVVARLSDKTGLDPERLTEVMHFHLNGEAVRYVFRVAAGLDSQVLGETQILGQVKHAYRQASLYKTVGPVISRLFHKCFQVAKKIRTETSVASGRVSIASAAVNTADAALSPEGLKGRKILIIGAGEMASHLCAHIAAKEPGEIVILSRTLSRARELAGRFNAKVKTVPQLGEALEESDVVFSAAGGTGHVLFKDELEPILERRKGRPWWIYDLGVPRNVEPCVGEVPNVTLANIDSFNTQVRTGIDKRKQEALKADTLIMEEVSKFQEWYSALAARPTIKDLTTKAEEARRVELRRTLARNDFSQEEAQALDSMTKALVRRLLHNPLSFTKSCHKHWRAEFNLSMVRKIFGLDG
ncbi:MAG: glutamyl-tRNA reductase [Deltaproteobacteria bacterium]|jgi:glutamyl-tRNA reductase|nr:glutamyl-tRNA reductase [Deltaproteobacteria bacterium]